MHAHAGNSVFSVITQRTRHGTPTPPPHHAGVCSFFSHTEAQVMVALWGMTRSNMLSPQQSSNQDVSVNVMAEARS
jgi:hypothetical protein